MISKFFTKAVSQYRLAYTGGKGSYTIIDTFSCHIEQSDSENQVFQSSSSKSYDIYCDITRDIRDGDKIIFKTTEFFVKGVKYYHIGKNKHIEIIAQKNDDEYNFISL